MKRPLILLALIVAAILAASWWFQRARPLPPPAAVVPIQDRATIDFSSGQPVVKDDAAEQALIDAALKDIEAAAKDIKFAPLVPPKIELPAAPKK